VPASEKGPAADDDRRAQRLERSLDDHGNPLYTIGQAAELLGVEPGVLRRLEATAEMAPTRSSGRHRRYSRDQLEHARRLLDLVQDGMSAGSARRLIALQDENATLRARLETHEAPGS
jgi:MerR family transcriptional regulator/heat shock protein HspR